MGGYSSGRYRTRNAGTLEHYQRIDMRRLRRMGFVVPGARASGPLRWSVNGSETGSVNATVDLRRAADGGGSLRIAYALNGSPRSDVVAIEARPCRYGGSRFYFVCPVSGRRCEVLVFAHGRWASRQAQRLAYASQSEDALGTLYRRRDRAEARLRGEKGNPRPRGANRERLLDAWIAAEEAADALFEREVVRRFGRYGLRFPDDL